ncbi:squalene--hopene cyclase [Cupriavidus pauculus]|uniref:squalene--hopene cyclase n=1 Tax=Cupriavidus pauculus TaxID=82633 RepID=UPI001243BBD9|nr:squalene--hopene cyclase [Cupriavidus pauculus]KAB0600484.1 squalene--hopene cyclase [Cupriavidus pauculus]MCM3605592.1 squalene--hopene cyclase [Cupriavidus pauculus]UAL02419.1 squalene--hopene cyclase [Cupriavidus pauculus]
MTSQDFSASDLDASLTRARDALLNLQHADGHWCFELESDATITAEYILMMHFVDEIDTALQARMARYLRNLQRLDGHGAWDLYHGGAVDVSCSVKAYFALKAAGDSPDAPHMQRARDVILQHGGAAKSNVFTRILLATFGEVPWRATPFMPVEFVLFPRWAPIHMDKVAYWARTTMVPLLVLCSIRAQARNPLGVHVQELFVTPPELETGYFPRKRGLPGLFLKLDRLVRHAEPLIPRLLRRKAIERAVKWSEERMNGEDGFGGIFPPMVYAYEMMVLLGYAKDHPLRRDCMDALKKLIVHRDDGVSYCQPCLSPVWDTAWSLMALEQAPADARTAEAIARGYDWLTERQVLDLAGDWEHNAAPATRPGGWAFQYANPYYPDVDDTAVVLAMLHAHGKRTGQSQRFKPHVDRALDWSIGLQSRNGGFGAFDANCDRNYLNAIPFADHGALLDPPTEDVSGRVLLALGVTNRPQDATVRERCIAYLRDTQQRDGSWWGRWGTNYIYGTWSVLAGLALAGVDKNLPMVRNAIAWLRGKQNADGGWGETNDSYLHPELAGTNDGRSLAEQTAWALLGQLALGEHESESVRRGVAYLIDAQREDGFWMHPFHNAPGFPRIFHLKYHGYTAYFPLWALGRYRRLMHGTQPAQQTRAPQAQGMPQAPVRVADAAVAERTPA